MGTTSTTKEGNIREGQPTARRRIRSSWAAASPHPYPFEAVAEAVAGTSGLREESTRHSTGTKDHSCRRTTRPSIRMDTSRRRATAAATASIGSLADVAPCASAPELDSFYDDDDEPAAA